MAGQFYRGNEDNVVGGPARWVITAATYAAPTRLEEIFDLSTFNLNATYGWRECGLTDEPAVIRIGASAAEFRNQQYGLYRVKPNEWNGSARSRFLETSQTNRTSLLSFAKAATDPVAGQKRTNYVAATNFEKVRLVCAFLDDNDKAHAIVMPAAQWSGEDIEETVDRSDMLKIPMTWRLFPDDQLIDTTTGLAIIKYELYQT